MDDVLKVLLVEDSEDDALILIRHLKKSGLNPVSQRVETIDALRSALKTSLWDVILCDVAMPNLDALGTLKEIKSSGVNIPFIAVSGVVPEEQLVDLMRAGAHDIIVKDRLSRLVPAIERGIEEAAVRRERKRAETRLLQATESISEGFALFDADDRLIVCNSMYRWLYERSGDVIMPGARYEEILRTGVERGEYPAAVGRSEEWIAERLDKLRKTSGPIEQELEGNRWILINERRMRDGGTVGIHTDITAIKNAEKELRNKEQFLRLITDNLPTLISYIDRDGRYRFVNRTGAQWYAKP
ncbi:MAG TPA: PAS-domain containing protein, partial [Desulfuromonadales bacterium]|nr:PAS-domain containing protein [Desulfuromonadales bacterium]